MVILLHENGAFTYCKLSTVLSGNEILVILHDYFHVISLFPVTIDIFTLALFF